MSKRDEDIDKGKDTLRKSIHVRFDSIVKAATGCNISKENKVKMQCYLIAAFPSLKN